MHKLKPIIFLLSALSFFACEKDTQPEVMAPDLKLEAPSDRGRSFVTLNGSISNLSQVKEAGFVLWETGSKGSEVNQQVEKLSDSRITASIKNLKPGTTYSYYMYAGNDINRKATEEQDFTTPKTSAALVSSIIQEGNKFTALIEDDGGSNITTKGFCWSTSGNASIFDNTILVEGNSSTLVATIPTLTSSNSYSIRAFAQNTEGYLAYGPLLKHEVEVKIEDPVFKAYLLENFDTNKDGVLSMQEVLAVKQIEIYTDNVRSLKGIEYFINLKSLQCRGEDFKYNEEQNRKIGTGLLTTLDISKNMHLAELNCKYNQLSKINTENNKNLYSINIDGNSITDFNCNNNLNLELLSANNNPLGKIDLSKNSKLTYVIINDAKLSSLDISNNINLLGLDCNNNELRILDIRKNKSLKEIQCQNNLLKEINTSQNKELFTLICGSNQIKILNTSSNPLLEYLYCYNNELTSLDITRNTKLRYLDCSNNKIGPDLDISKNTKLEEFIIWNDQNGDGFGDSESNPNIKTLWVWDDFHYDSHPAFPKNVTIKKK